MIAKQPNLLVLRVDTTTGLHVVGWDSDMPIGRFRHVEVICETQCSQRIGPHSENHALYLAACDKARTLNIPILEQQVHEALRRGWIQIPLDLHATHSNISPDSFGNR